MAIKICLMIDDNGAMTVSTEDVQAEQGEMGEAPGAGGTPVANIDEALAAIKSMAEAGAMAPPAGDTEIPAGPTEQPAAAPPGNPEEEAMMQSFGGGAPR